MKKEFFKTKRILIWLGIIVVTTIVSCLWCLLWNNVFCDGAMGFFRVSRLEDILSTFRAASTEEVLWRFIPFIIISYILLLIKYESDKTKKIISCSVAFLIMLAVSVQFGYAHYSVIFETKDWIFKHIVLQGTMGLFYAVAYNVVQHFSKKALDCRLIYSHLLALLTTFIIHSATNIIIIIRLTY